MVNCRRLRACPGNLKLGAAVTGRIVSHTDANDKDKQAPFTGRCAGGNLNLFSRGPSRICPRASQA